MLNTKTIITSLTDIPDTWIFEYYCSLNFTLHGQDVKINSVFNSKDKNPSMFIYNRNGKYKFKDFSSGKGGSSLSLVMALFDLSVAEAINKIITDFSKYLETNKTPYKKVELPNVERYSVESYQIRGWTEKDAKYWQAYHIGSKILSTYKVKPLQSFLLSKKEDGVYKFLNMERPYTYGFFNDKDELYKIYMPYNTISKFIKVKSEVQGYNQLDYNKKYLIITSSLKDGLALKSLGFPIEFVAPESEGVLISKDKIALFKEKYVNIICIFDNDEAGKRYVERYKKEYNIDNIDFELEKDIAEAVKVHGVEKTRNYLYPLLQIKLKKD